MGKGQYLLAWSSWCLLAAGCGGDPDLCGAMHNFAEACPTGDSGAAVDQMCSDIKDACDKNAEGQLASFYDCMADRDACEFNDADVEACGNNLSFSSLMCLQDLGGAESCEGSPLCDWYFDETSCEAVPGCTWTACSGTAYDCTFFNDPTSCNAQAGCSHDGMTCTGTAAACSTLDAVTCNDQQGCSTNNDCTGTPTVACSDFADQPNCEAIDGCYWY